VSLSPFQRLLEDVLREELLTMGLDYATVVESVAEKREDSLFAIRFRGDVHDVDVVEPDELPSRIALAALIRRKLEATLRHHG
jgi:hypothetical protein